MGTFRSGGAGGERAGDGRLLRAPAPPGGRAHRGWRQGLIAVALLAACSRRLDLPQQGTRSAGAACEKSTECGSGVCGDGICCAKACAATESCAVAGQLGSCAPRPTGAACKAAADCPTGACADGVCCESACNGTCQTCAVHPGKCEDAPDNTDARRECGLCSACFQRTCAPAQPGTDPNARCPSGQLCGASQSCGLPGGAACTADLDCALGQCIAGACEQVTVERIQVDPMAQNPTGRSVRGLALSPSGGLGVLFGEYSETGAHSVQAESDLFLAQRSPQGVITATSLFTDRDVTRGRLIAAVTYLGPTALVVASSREAENTGCAAAGEPPCGVFAMLVSPAGQAGRPEVVDGAIRVADQVVLRQDESGAVFAFYDGEAPGDTGQKIRVRRRDVTPTGVVWTALGVIDPGLPDWGYVSWDAEVLDGKPVVLVADSSNANTLKLWQPGVAADVAPLPSPGGECDPFSVRAIRAGAPGHERLLVSFGCYRTFEFATWDPVARWSIAEYGAVLLLQPLGAPGGAAASVAELDSPDSTPIAELHLGLQQGGTWSDRLLFRPRGAEDVDTFAAAAGPGGLPQVAVATGLVASDPSGGSPFIRGLNLFLIRVHP